MIFQDHTVEPAPDDPRYSFCFCPRLYVGCICPFFFFFRLCHFPRRFFSPRKERLFFFRLNRHLKIPADISRRGIINYRVVARTDVSDSASLSLFLLFFLFSDLEFWALYVYMYGNRRISRARLLGTNKNAIVCMVPPGERRRVALHRIASHRRTGEGEGCWITSTWKRRCKTILRDSIKLLLSDRLSRPLSEGDRGRGRRRSD